MKYLRDYIDDKQSALFKETGTFFAFSNKQFDESSVEDVKYVNMGMGMICPEDNVSKLIKELDKIYKEGIKQDLTWHSKKQIIHRELANHECQISMDITDCVEKLSDYPITIEEIQAEWKEFYNRCVENDWF